MEAYDLSPDHLIAKAFRNIQSRDPGFRANSKAEWVAEIKKIYKRKGVAGLQHLRKNHFHLYLQAKWLFGGMDEGFRFIGLDPEDIRLRSLYDEELMMSSLAMADALAKLLIAKGIVTDDEFKGS